MENQRMSRKLYFYDIGKSTTLSDIIKNMDTLTSYKGVAEDPRTDEQKALDYSHHDILGGSPALWTEKTSWTTLDLRKQSSSSSCGMQAGAKAITFFDSSVMSALPYKFRSNYPSLGMYQQDVGSILVNKKTTTEVLAPSEEMTEDQMNSAVIPNLREHGISAYYFLPVGNALNMDLLAQALQQGHSLHIGLSSNIDEWTDVPKVLTEPLTFSHFVCSVPNNFLLHNGEKAVIIDDSCNAYSTLGGTGQRILTESFIKARVWGIMALIPLLVTTQTKPVHTFNADLSFGSTGVDVKALQDILKYEKVMPSEIDSTGYFGTLTKAAVIKLQEKYATEILKPANLTHGTGYVGTLTRTWLNKNYG